MRIDDIEHLTGKARRKAKSEGTETVLFKWDPSLSLLHPNTDN